jgi:hypothetical protein
VREVKGVEGVGVPTRLRNRWPGACWLQARRSLHHSCKCLCVCVCVCVCVCARVQTKSSASFALLTRIQPRERSWYRCRL